MAKETEGARTVFHLRLRHGEAGEHRSSVVVEAPLEIRLDAEPVAITLRTPGNDVELALGFLVSEGVIEDPGAIASVAHCEQEPGVIEVRTVKGAPGVHPPAIRHFQATASCGACGKRSLDELRVRAPSLREDRTRVGARTLLALPERLQAAQPLFHATGSLHAAALFDAQGSLRCLREDVGRHNAVDKIIGWAALRSQLPLSCGVLLVSGACGSSTSTIAPTSSSTSMPLQRWISFSI